VKEEEEASSGSAFKKMLHLTKEQQAQPGHIMCSIEI